MTHCKACGAQVVFVTNSKTGKKVPLDIASRAHIYELSDSADDVAAPAGQQQELYVSHFLTCPKADLF